jgi:tRNA(Ile)-lysidine synthase
MTQHEWKSQVNSVLQQAQGQVLLAVSGGVDSMVLLHLLYQFNQQIVVAHVNYGLRGEESDLDEVLVKNECAKLAIPFESIQADTIGFCRDNKVGIQEAARIIRYTWFEKLKKQYGIINLLTAHHLTDNIETFIMNAMRGSGTKGLKSMVVINNQTGIIRPLLGVSKKDILSYAQANNISFREDSSNAKNDYLRNCIRNECIPVLLSIDPEVERKIGKTLDYLKEDYEYMALTLERDAERIIKKSGSVSRISNYQSIHPRLLRYFLEKYEFPFSIISQLSRVQQSGKIIHGLSHTLLVDREDILIRSIDITREQVNKVITGEGVFRFTHEMSLRFSVVEGNNRLFDTSKTCFLDADISDFPFTVRNWNNGDFLIPLGMKGKKKVSDILIDKKLSIWEKEEVLVLESNGSIQWLVGLQASEKGKITSTTKKMIKIETAP